MSKGRLHVLRSLLRGHSDHGWLNTYHTFSFADYYNPDYEKFGCLRVINEDRVTPGNGFPTHGHREYEIYSYVVSGELTHKDSLGNVETIKRGDVQFTSAGTGIRHSEYNMHPTLPVHFLQIWVKPKVSNLTPSYNTLSFTDEQKKNRLCLMVSPQEDGKSIILIHNDIFTYASILEKDNSLDFSAHDGRKVLVQVVTTIPNVKLKVEAKSSDISSDLELGGGDVLFVTAPIQEDMKLRFTGASESNVEFLLFDIGSD